MTFTQLEVFAALARINSFSKAALTLGITQSAVSHAIRSLETELGVALFDREGGTTSLTQAGVRLLARSNDILTQHEALKQEAANMRGLASGKLRVASFGSTSSLRLLPKLLAAFRKKHPGIEVLIDEDEDDVVVQWLLEQRVELGFVVMPDERFETLQLLEDEFVVLLPEQHRLANRRSVALTDLNGEPFIRTEAGCGPLIDRLLNEAGARPNQLYRFEQLYSILGFVAQGHAVGIAARMALPDQYAGVVYRPLSPRAKRLTGLAFRSLDKLSPAALAFVNAARAVATQGRFS
jgi:DNA-binding transcriptional LysR family regulator